VSKLFEQLKKEAEYAQRSLDGNLLYEIYGKVKMARQLGAIDGKEFVELNHETIYFINTNKRACEKGFIEDPLAPMIVSWKAVEHLRKEELKNIILADNGNHCMEE